MSGPTVEQSTDKREKKGATQMREDTVWKKRARRLFQEIRGRAWLAERMSQILCQGKQGLDGLVLGLGRMVDEAITGILAAIDIPNWGSLISTYRLNAAGRQLYADLQRARMRAVMENTTFKIVSLATHSTYTFQREDIDLETKPLPAGISILADSTRSFTSRGTASNGRIRLCNFSKKEYKLILSIAWSLCR